MSFLWVIGGFLSLITRMTNFSLANYQSFTIDKSLIKKIFSWKETLRSKNRSFYDKGNSEDDGGYNYDKKQGLLKETIMSRHVFRYNWTQRFWANVKKKMVFVICCGCCCLNKKRICCFERRKHSRSKDGKNSRSRLYAEGLAKLYVEIDLLEVVKQLRISRFMSSIFLTANQRELIKF